jgi:hypothetical protein
MYTPVFFRFQGVCQWGFVTFWHFILSGWSEELSFLGGEGADGCHLSLLAVFVAPGA